MRTRLAFLVLFAVGCGGASVETDGGAPGSGGACDLRATSMFCQHYDFDAASLTVYEGACTENGGTWIDGECPRASALGGCRTTQPGFGDLTTWFYSGGVHTDASQVQAACEGSASPGVFVTP